MDVEQSLERAIGLAQGVLWREKKSNGGWNAQCHYGPWCTAQTLLALDFVGQLDPDLADEAVRHLAEQQQDDEGPSLPYPYHQHDYLAPTPD